MPDFYQGIRYPNVHRVDGWVTYGQTLSVTANAKISQNVMPWFKAGTHDRIFNVLLQHSLPLTDPSTWLTEHFTDSEDIVRYDLKGIVRRSLIWTDCVEQIMEAICVIPSSDRCWL